MILSKNAYRLLQAMIILEESGVKWATFADIRAYVSFKTSYPIDMLLRKKLIERQGKGEKSLFRPLVERSALKDIKIQINVNPNNTKRFKPMKFDQCPYKGRRYEDVSAGILNAELIGWAYTPLRSGHARAMSDNYGE